MVHEYSEGNQDHTVAFLKYLQLLFQESTRLVIIWDGASYHRSAIVREFLQQVNGALPPEQWRITCIRLAQERFSYNSRATCLKLGLSA